MELKNNQSKIDNTDTSLKLVVLGYDWNQLCINKPDLVIKKLQRDRLNPDKNNITLLGFSLKSQLGQLSDKVNFSHAYGFSRHARFLYDFLMIFRVAFYFKKNKTSQKRVLIVTDPGFFFASIIPKLLYGIPVVMYLGNAPRTLAWVQGKYIRYLYMAFCESLGKKVIDSCFVISNETRVYAEKYLSIKDKSQIHEFFPDVITLEDMPEKDSEFSIHAAHSIPEAHNILISVGRLEAEKNHSELLYFFAEYLTSYPETKLIIIGSGSLLSTLQALVKRLHIESGVVFVPFADRKTVWNYLYKADAFILLSKSEGLGLVFLEAQYAGLPIMALKVGGLLDTIGVQGERGYYYERNMAKDKVNVQKILKKDTEVQAMLARAKEYVNHKLHMQTSINDVY